MSTTPPAPPTGLRRTGRALWRAVLADFDLDEHERTLLLQACRTGDSLDALQATVDTEGVVIATPQGPRAHPALVEARQQRIALARILAALQIPSGEETENGRTRPHGGARGVYAIRGGVS